MRITTLLDNVFCLFYPRTCFACGDPLPQGKEIVCTTCHYELPNTNFVNIPDNEFVKRLWGRVPIHHASAMYYFVKGGLTQSLIRRVVWRNAQTITVLYRHRRHHTRTTTSRKTALARIQPERCVRRRHSQHHPTCLLG